MLTCPHYYDDDIDDLIRKAAGTFAAFGLDDDDYGDDDYWFGCRRCPSRRHYDATYDDALLQALRDLWYATAVELGLLPKSECGKYWQLLGTDGDIIDYDRHPDLCEAREQEIEAAFMAQVREQHDRLAACLEPDDTLEYPNYLFF